jgi:branched-chain amino acid transport system substrate-binding protein
VIRRSIICVAVLATIAMLATGCSEPERDAATEDTSAAAPSSDCTGDQMLECARASTIGDLVPDEPTAADGEPITIGMINQENTAAGSYPELSSGADAAIAFVNEQLGGLDGRPIELEVCNTGFSAEGSTSCGQQFVEEGVPVVMGGIDVFGNGIEVLADNQVPFVGGIPVSEQSVTSPNSFQWSGGSWGATVAFADYAANELDAEKVAIIFGEFGSITQSAEYAKKVLDRAGVTTQLVPYPIMATDVSSAIQAAAAGEPDAIFMLAADAGCAAGYEGMQTLGVTAQRFFTGACVSPTILGSVDPAATDGTIFNVEGPISTSDPTPDAALYQAVIEQYGDGVDAKGAATVTFRAFINLYSIMRGLGVEGSTPAGITDALAAQVDTPSFMGHAYTCNGEQFAGLPAMCSPQQILGQVRDGELEQITDWIDVGAIYGD